MDEHALGNWPVVARLASTSDNYTVPERAPRMLASSERDGASSFMRSPHKHFLREDLYRAVAESERDDAGGCA